MGSSSGSRLTVCVRYAHTRRMRVIVEMPEEIVSAVDKEAKRSSRNRSDVIRSLLRHGLGTCSELCPVCLAGARKDCPRCVAVAALVNGTVQA